MTLFQVYFKDMKLIVVLRSLPNLEQTGPLHMSPVDRAGPLTVTNVIFWVHTRIFSPVSEMTKGRRRVVTRNSRKKQTWRNTKLYVSAYYNFSNSCSCITDVKWDAYDVENTKGKAKRCRIHSKTSSR